MEGWGVHTLKSFGINCPDELPECYVNFFVSLQLCYRDQGYFLSHAGLDMSKDDPPAETEPAQMLWGDATHSAHPSNLHDERLITGHKIRTLDDIVRSCKSSHIYLDNGAFTGNRLEYGNLMALDLDTLKLTAQPWLDGAVVL
jgi:serine/threonine protein phosphatase 1